MENNLVTEADLQVQKQVIRSQMRLILRRIDWTEISISVLQKLSTYLQNSFQNKVIAGYWPIENEIQILPFLKELCLKKGSVCLPVVEEKDQPLKFYNWTPDIEMETGPYQIPIPKEKIKPIAPDIILIPLVAFDRNGYRLGRGGGYYDRTIHKLKFIKPIQTIGLASEPQLLQQLPHSDYDQPLDGLITEKQIYRFKTW